MIKQYFLVQTILAKKIGLVFAYNWESVDVVYSPLFELNSIVVVAINGNQKQHHNTKIAHMANIPRCESEPA